MPENGEHPRARGLVRIALENLDRVAHGSQRVPKLVRESRQELALPAIHDAELVETRPKRLLELLALRERGFQGHPAERFASRVSVVVAPTPLDEADADEADERVAAEAEGEIRVHVDRLLEKRDRERAAGGRGQDSGTDAAVPRGEKARRDERHEGEPRAQERREREPEPARQCRRSKCRPVASEGALSQSRRLCARRRDSTVGGRLRSASRPFDTPASAGHPCERKSGIDSVYPYAPAFSKARRSPRTGSGRRAAGCRTSREVQRGPEMTRDFLEGEEGRTLRPFRACTSLTRWGVSRRTGRRKWWTPPSTRT